MCKKTLRYSPEAERGSILPLPLMFYRHASKGIATLALVGTLFAVEVSPAPAQDSNGSPQTPHTPALTVNARLVVLDVVVTDKNGKPVDGLTAKDFQVFEDNQPQRIRSFESPSAHGLPAEAVASGMATVFDPANPATFGQSPVTILVLDQLNTHFADSSFARRSLHDYLAKQPALLSQPTTLLAVYDNHFKLQQAFTRDRDALLKALAKTPTENAWKLEVNGSTEYGPLERLDQSLRALEQIAQSNARIPGRKNLIWVGGGFPTPDPTSIDGDDAQEVKDTLQHITDVLLDTRVTLYAVDPSSSAAGLTEITDISQAAFVSAAGDGFGGGVDPFNATEDFDRLGPVTGGRVIRGMNNISQQIAMDVDLSAKFYTIGYSPSSSSTSSAQYRKIRVVCVRPGLTVATRDGYYPARTTQEKSADTTAYDLTTAAESTIPLNGLHITVEQNHSIASAPESYIVHVGAAGLTWKPKDDGGSTASVAVMAVSLNAKNKMIAHVLHGMTATARSGANLRDETKTANFEFEVQPAAKATTLRFIVRDAATGRMGSVDLPLTK